MSEPLESRIIDLETQVAHQGRMVEELNEVVTAQATLIDRLQRKLDALVDGVAELGEIVNSGHPVTRPPHY